MSNSCGHAKRLQKQLRKIADVCHAVMGESSPWSGEYELANTVLKMTKRKSCSQEKDQRKQISKGD